MVNPSPFEASKASSLQDEDFASNSDVLSGDNYPELKLRMPPPHSPIRAPEPSAPEGEKDGEAKGLEAEEEQPQEHSPEAWQRHLTKFLEEGRVLVFTRGAEQLMIGLESDRIEARRWSMETIRALVETDASPAVPPATLSLFLSALGRSLNTEADDALRDLAGECTALLIGALASAGELDEACEQLARIIRYAGASGPELRKRILASKHLGFLPLRLYFREGRSVLESLILPLFRMAGQDGCRGLIGHLEKEENRQRRSRILEILKALAPLSCEPVKESLGADAWYLVRNALNLLGEIGDPDSFETVSRFLEHPDLRIRRAAMRAFWKTGGLCAESYLVDLLPRCDAETQGDILVGLVQIRAASAVAPIASLAIQAEEPLRIKAIEALEQLGPLAPSDAIPTLATFLEQKGRLLKTRHSAAVREASARALAALGTPEAIAALARAVQEAPRNGDQETLRKIQEQRSRI